MTKGQYDLIVIGSGSGGLSVGLFMAKAGFKVLMVSKSDHDIGGDCLNDGCVPSKSFIHAAKIVRMARVAKKFGLTVSGSVDINKVVEYVHERQERIREHENAAWLKNQGIDVALGDAKFTGKNSIRVDCNDFTARKIVIATGSRPKRLKVKGVEKVHYYDNESIFQLSKLPGKLLVIGGGPIGMEIAQSMQSLGTQVTVVHKGSAILEHDAPEVTEILLDELSKQGINFYLNTVVQEFPDPNIAKLLLADKTTLDVSFDAIFVAIGRETNPQVLAPENAGILVKDHQIVSNNYLQTSNKNIFVCGDVAGDLQFSHAAEFHARILLNNFFSPFKKKLNNDHMSWVTFTDPEVATFGLNEHMLRQRNIPYLKLEHNFKEDDRAVTDNYQYSKILLFISQKAFLRKQKILGGTMVAPNAGEIIQELILANAQGLSIDVIFDKIYPYPVASRINQKVILDYKSNQLTALVAKFLRLTYRIFN